MVPAELVQTQTPIGMFLYRMSATTHRARVSVLGDGSGTYTSGLYMQPMAVASVAAATWTASGVQRPTARVVRAARPITSGGCARGRRLRPGEVFRA